MLGKLKTKPKNNLSGLCIFIYYAYIATLQDDISRNIRYFKK